MSKALHHQTAECTEDGVTAPRIPGIQEAWCQHQPPACNHARRGTGNRTSVLRGAVSSLALACALMTPQVASAEEVAARKTRIIASASYTFLKYVHDKGEVRSEVLDGRGQVLSDKAVPPGEPALVDPRVLALMEKLERSGLTAETITVNIALDLPTQLPEETTETGEAEVRDGLTARGAINGKAMSEKELEAYSEAYARKERDLRTARTAARARHLLAWATRHGLQGHKGLEEALNQGREGVTLALTPRELRALIDTGDGIIAGIDLYTPGEDDITQAMGDTNITGYALPNSSTRGDDIGIYMTESGCADESRLTNYDRLAGSETDHSRNVGAILRAVSPDSFIYCRGNAVLPQDSDLDGVGGNPPIYIVTRSNSNNDNTDYTTLDRDWDNFMYNSNIATFNSGGNTGSGTGNVRSPGKGLNLVTVGNYDDATNTIAGTSPFVDLETGNNKPEVVAPGSNITAGGFTFSGTSQATPHAAAFTADMMSSSTYLQYRPYLAKAKLLAGATDPITGGYDKVGLGGIDFLSAQWSGYWQWYAGGNGSFSYFDGQDGHANGYVEKQVYISNTWDQVRVVLSWLTRGSYTYNHRNDAHPIGMDLDLQVYDPHGNYVGGSYSWDNPFERVNFTPTVSGYYTFKINRFANRDTSLGVRMGLYVNYYDQ